MVRTPLRKTSTMTSLLGSPLPSVTVVSLPSGPGSSVSLPFFDCLPLSVMGSLKTSVLEPSFFVISEHLNAHFCVSRCIFCSKAPPEPNTRFSAAQPFAAAAVRISPSDSYEMPSPWMSRMYGGSSLCPVAVVVTSSSKALPRRSRSWGTITGGSPESGRTTRRPLRVRIFSFSALPHRFVHALNTSYESETTATTPSGYWSSMFSKALSSPSRPHEVMVECSAAGIEMPGTGTVTLTGGGMSASPPL
mmetsp:Transcript_30880/g.80616  ORF Transcript_30880/g.80616 Transcript_30880/m.80616 type:complete len:248 (+) Transcript_30880:753-1496(+)